MIAWRFFTSEAIQRRSQHHAIVCQLLQKTDLSAGGCDRGLIVLAHLFLDNELMTFFAAWIPDRSM